MGRLEGITVDIGGTSALANFEVIEIIDDNSAYPTLLGIDWAIDMNIMINLKKHKIVFKKNSLCIVVPLNPSEGVNYTELVCNDESNDELDCIYKINTR